METRKTKTGFVFVRKFNDRTYNSQEISYLVQAFLYNQRALEPSEIIDIKLKSLLRLLQCKFTPGHILSGI